MKHIGGLTLLLIAIAGLATANAGAAAGSKPDVVRYTAKTDESKLRIGVRGDRVVGMVFHSTSVCRNSAGDVVDPYYGSGVTSGFNSTNLSDSGSFRSSQRYRNRNPVTHKPMPFVRDLRGSVDGATGKATVSIHYKTPLHRFRGELINCRTGKVPFDLERVGRRLTLLRREHDVVGAEPLYERRALDGALDGPGGAHGPRPRGRSRARARAGGRPRSRPRRNAGRRASRPRR